MKKSCTECGNQLELSQRLCTKCGAPNPFFTSAFSFLSDQSGELEKLRVEKERIEKELSEKEEQQAEFIRQEQLKKEAEDAEKLKIENEKRKNAKKSEAEREQFEKELKEEILKIKKVQIHRGPPLGKFVIKFHSGPNVGDGIPQQGETVIPQVVAHLNGPAPHEAKRTVISREK